MFDRLMYNTLQKGVYHRVVSLDIFHSFVIKLCEAALCTLEALQLSSFSKLFFSSSYTVQGTCRHSQAVKYGIQLMHIF